MVQTGLDRTHFAGVVIVPVERRGTVADRNNHGGRSDGSSVRQAVVDRINAGRGIV